MCWRTVLLEDVSVMRAVAPASLHYAIARSYATAKTFIGRILFSGFKVDFTALLAEQIGQNGPETTSYFSQGSVATVCR